ncbi:MAG: hypothetical protein J6C93_05250 [Clostridia bacterium]|nr:hypothetical protein [Clostridia bacterium]
MNEFEPNMTDELQPNPLPKSTKRSKAILVLKILAMVAYLAITAWFVIGFFTELYGESENAQLSAAMFLTIIVIIFGSIFYPVPIVLSIIGLVLSALAVKRGQGGKGSVAYFITFIALPVVTYLILIFVFPLFTGTTS